MRAVHITRFGGPEVLEPVELPDPLPHAGEVLIAVHVVEVLFLDTQLRTGWGTAWFPMRPPWVPGTGVAGTVAAVGAGIEPGRVGERVVARTGDQGAYAELVVVPAEDAVPVPDGLDLATATAALHDGVLALDRLGQARIEAGTSVLVTAAAGSLGHWFVPLAKASGAFVAGAAGGARKVAAVAALGAEPTVDYRRDDWVRWAGGPFDVVFDGAGGAVGTQALERTAPGGLFFGHGAASGDFGATRPRPDVTVVGVERRIGDEDWRRLVHRGLDLLARRAVRPAIGQEQPLERAAQAHAAMAERSVIGKTVLLV